MIRFLFISAFALLAAACVNPSIVSQSTEIVDRSFGVGGGGTRDGGNSFSIAAKGFNSGGKLAVCAAIAVDGSSSFSNKWGPAIADALQVSIDGDLLMRGTKFAAIYVDEVTVMGKQANCAITDEPWNAKWNGKPTNFRTGAMEIRD